MLRTYAKKIIFWTTKSQKFSLFVQKKLLHCHLLLCIEKLKLALKAINRNHRNLPDIGLVKFNLRDK